MSRRCRDWGIYRWTDWTGIFDHLWQPDIQTRLAAHVDQHLMYHRHGALCDHWVARTKIEEIKKEAAVALANKIS